MSKIPEVPDYIKQHGCNFHSSLLLEEIDKYLQLDGIGLDQPKEALLGLKQNVDKYKHMPVCILSHKYDKKRSLFLANLLKMLNVHILDREYIIFTYSDQAELYSQFESIDNLTVHYIPVDKKKYSTLTGKRQYILEYCQSNGHDNSFFIEDDCTDFCLPVGANGVDGEGNFRNKRFFMSYNLTFSFWEYVIKKNDLQYSGPCNNMEFAFRDLSKNPMLKPYGQTVQAVHINTKSCLEKNIKFDEESGWDDYDMLIQQAVYNKGSTVIIFSYTTPTLKSGVSSMSATADALAKRCQENTTKLINKWGTSFVREDTKKGLYNAKVNWFTIKAALKNDVELARLIHLDNETAKKLIKVDTEEVSGKSSTKGGLNQFF